MYYSALVKQELARIIPSKDCEQNSELLAFIMMNGKIDSKGKLSIAIDNPSMIKVVYFLVKRTLCYEAKIEIIKKNNKKKTYLIIVNDKKKIDYIINKFNLIPDKYGKLIRSTLSEEEKSQAIKDISNKSFLRGAFLAGGFVNDPERMYHLEISCPSKKVAQVIEGILHDFSFSAKTSFWQKKWTVYLKKSEEIFTILDDYISSLL